jgi:polyvinyl alcohol dehydrogenase (cytochrome)
MAFSIEPLRATGLGIVGLFALGFVFGCSSDGESDGGAGGSGGEGIQPSGGAGPTGSRDWPMLGYNPQNTFFNTAETKISLASVKDLEVAWTADFGASINGAPVQVGNRLYASAYPPAIVCYELSSGAKVWESPGTSASSALALANGVLYVHDQATGFLKALDPEAGAVMWEVDPSTQEGHLGFSSPIVAGDLVLIGTSGLQEVVSNAVPTLRGELIAIDVDTRAPRWNTFNVPQGSTGASMWSSPAFSVDMTKVFTTTGNNYTEPTTDTSDAFIAYDITDGTILWKAQRTPGDAFSFAGGGFGHPDADFGASPVVFEAEVDGVMTKLVAAGQKNGQASVVRQDNGQLVWSRILAPTTNPSDGWSGASGVFNNTSWDGEHLLVACNSATSTAPGSEPLATETYTTKTAVLFALDPATGDTIWERQLKGQVMAPVTVANGVGFVGADRELQAFDVSTGEILFRHDVGGTIACPATIANGHVAVGSGLDWSFGTSATILTVLRIP